MRSASRFVTLMAGVLAVAAAARAAQTSGAAGSAGAAASVLAADAPASPTRAGAASAQAAGAAAATARPPAPAGPSPYPVAFGGALRWRLVGPFRGGRVLAVTGVPGQPETFYFGAVGGGVWRSMDAGRVWTPVFDGPPSGSIGALAVAPSNPDVVYVGTGEADMRSDVSFGDGMYRSTDGGRTFQAIGLRDSRQIGRILVDPRDPDVVLVAALGHGFGPNPERGVFRSADGGRSWQRVLHRDDDTGAIDLAADPADPQTVYAALWNVRRPPWSTYAPLGGPGSGLFKSSDGGQSWQELRGHGLPAGPFGRIGIAVAGGGSGGSGGSGGPRPVYALIDDPSLPGLYRSDDAGQSWSRVGADRRITSRPWYFGGLTADPRDPDTVYVANVGLYRSRDGGRSFQTIKGAPGGDDYHALWIDPSDPRRMIVGSDQGAQVSVDGAATWSSWFNQPTAQIYHVATDDRFPYTIFGAQQDSGTAAVVSRSDAGEITFRDWFSIGTGESGYILPDPTDADAVYGGSVGGELLRFSRRTSQVQDVSPTIGPPGAGAGIEYRYPWTPALAISPFPPHAIYQGSQYVHRSADRGMSWTVISPDLTAARGVAGGGKRGGTGAGGGHGVGASGGHGGGAASGGKRGGTGVGAGSPGSSGAGNRGGGAGTEGKAVIYSIAPSPLRAGEIWAGTDNGRVQLTLDEGRSWREVTPPGLPEWSMVSLVEASRWDAGTAYVAIDRHQMDDLRPYALRTRDFGKSWTPIAAGIAATAYVHAVREDPVRRGLLYAGTESGVYVSFDDGDRWQPLQLNLPAASVRDLAVHGDDLIAATHGRSFWVLDGLATLRQLDAAAVASPLRLFTPAPALRKRRGENRDTPLPPETPAGCNPPAGALIDYWLAAEPDGELTLEILDASGERVRRFRSDDPARQPEDAATYAAYWLRPAAPPAKRAGLNRFVWDLRYPAPPALRPQPSMDAVYGEDTPLEPEGPLVLPGTYELRLTAGGHTATASLRVEPDPRADVPAAALASQLALARRIDAAMAESHRAVEQLRELRRQLAALVPPPVATPATGTGHDTAATGPARPAATAGSADFSTAGPSGSAGPTGTAGKAGPGGPAGSGPAGSIPAGPGLPSGSGPTGSAGPAGSADRGNTPAEQPGDSELAAAAAALTAKVDALVGSEPGFPRAPEKQPSFTAVHAGLAALAVSVGTGDAAPTTQATAAFAAWLAQLDRALAAWAAVRAGDLPALNRRLAEQGLRAVELPP